MKKKKKKIMVPSLKPFSGKRKQKKYEFAVCDIEASNWIDFAIIGLYDGKEYQSFKLLREFIDYLLEDLFKKGISEVYAHFGGIYDFMFIMKESMQNDFKIIDMVPRGSGLLCFSIHPIGKPKKKIIFRDSSALFPFGLDKITKSFGVTHKKKKFDFSTWDGTLTPELEEYLMYDCIGLHEALTAYFNWPMIKKAGSATTMASQSLKVFRTFLYQTLKTPPKAVDEFVRSSYFGGRTEIFKPKYKNKTKTLKCYDVNSLYPTVMKNNIFPGNFKRWSNKYEPDSLGFYDATVIVPKNMKVPPLPTVQSLGISDKLIFPTGTFRGIFSTIELEYAKSVGCKILWTGRGAIFESAGHLFRDYITTLYERRMEAKKQGDGVGDVLCKLLMNSCYGRFGLNTEKEELVWDDGSVGLNPLCEITLFHRTRRLATRKKTLDKTFTNVAIAAWVTSLARIYMHKIYMQCQDELYYTDTDSIFTTKEFESGNELGDLKLEYEVNEAIFLLPKTYIVQSNKTMKEIQKEARKDFKKVAMKGFSTRKIQHFTIEDFEQALIGDKKLTVTHDEKMATMKTALKRFDDLVAKLPPQEKSIKSFYDKRQMVKKGRFWDSKPLHVENGVVI